jgi:hypothetical protein
MTDLDIRPQRRIETVDRRILGAFRLVDAVTGLPLGVPAVVDVLGATINGIPLDAVVDRHTVPLRQNRRGIVVVFGAPLFDTYTAAFENPAAPPETAVNPLRLRLAIASAGSSHLPRALTLDLPRALDPAAAASVLAAQSIEVLRSPNAGVQPAWAVLRVRVTRAGVNPLTPLGAVLVRVFRSPRAPADRPIGVGMTEWRGAVAGEALVAISDIQRFRPGAGANVLDTDLAIELEASRHDTFTGVAGVVPDVDALIAGAGQGFIRPPTQPPGSQLTVLQPATAPPMRVQAGREYVVHLAMP